jgi:hypothetical protein
MNKHFLMAACALALCSCGNEANTPAEDVKKEADRSPAANELSVVAVKAGVTLSEATIVLTGDDIELYNGTTKRIVLKTALTCDDFFRRMGDNSKLAFYLGEELLFEAVLGTDDPGAVYDEPVFTASCGDEASDDKYFLFDGYPYAGKLDHPGWIRFIQYLIETMKLVEAADPVTPVVPADPVDRIVGAITCDDIKLFNVTTGEIVFTDLTVDDLLERRAGLSPTLSFYLGETLLFEVTVVSPVDNRTCNDLVLYYDYDDGKFYLPDGYPASNSEEALRIRAENAQKRKAEWDMFINNLADAGKTAE